MNQIESVRPGRADTVGRCMPWAMLAVVWLVQSGILLAPQVAGPLATFIQGDLRISRAEIGLFASAFAAGAMLSLIPGGRLADRFGVRRQILAGPAIAGAGLFLVSLAPVFPLTIFSMLISGLGAGIAGPAYGKAVAGWFATGLRATAMSIVQTAMSISGAAAGAFLPALALSYSWRTAVELGAFTVFGIAVVCFLAYREAPPAHGADSPTQPPSAPEVRPYVPAARKGSLRAVLGDRSIRLACLYCIFATSVQVSFSSYLVLYLKERLNVDISTGGILLAVSWMMGIAGRVLVGLASDQVFSGRRKELLSLNALAIAVVAVAMILVPEVSWTALVVLVAVFGFVASGWTGTAITLIQELSGRHATGVGTGAGLFACYVGILAGPPIFGLLVDISHSYVVGWVFLAACGALATLSLLPVKERLETAGK